MDASLYRWINDLARRTSWLHGPLELIAGPGIAVFALLLLVAYLDGRRRNDPRAVAAAVWAGGAALLALAVAQVIGGLVGRARPYDVLGNAQVLVARTTDVSFPSDHATTAGAVAGGLLLANRRIGLVAAVAAVIMAAARVYVGAHYPGDVVAGLALGGAVAVAGHALVVPALGRLVERLSVTPLGRLVRTAPRPA